MIDFARKPIVAGQFYPSDRNDLLKSIENSFRSSFGPGRLPSKRGKEKIKGVLSPHAGYPFSGAGAAKVFKEIGESDFPEAYLILGVNHGGTDTCISDENWKTPLGEVQSDKDLIRILVEKGIDINNDAHHYEHSIEVQLPFLQYVSKDREKELKVVCMMVAQGEHEKIGENIWAAIKDKDVMIICSSDFTHYGTHYRYIPFSGDVRKNMEKLDMGAVKFVKNKDAKGFLDYVEKTGATICGKAGISVMLWLMKKMKTECEVLGYYTSGDVMGDYSNAVGYASIVFRKTKTLQQATRHKNQ